MSSQYPVLDCRPINQWKVTELRDELRRRNLPMKGLKEDLVRRLSEAISGNGEPVNGEELNNNNTNPGSDPLSNCDEEDETLLLDGDSKAMGKSDEKTNMDFISLPKNDDNEGAEMATKAQDIEAIQASSDVVAVDERTVDVICMEDSSTCSQNMVIKLDSGSGVSQSYKKADDREALNGEELNSVNPSSDPLSNCDEEDEKLLLDEDSETMDKSDEKINSVFTSLTKDDDNEGAEMATKAQDMEAIQISSDVTAVDETKVDVIHMKDSLTCSQNMVIKFDSGSEGSQNYKKDDNVFKAPADESDVNHFKPKHVASDLSKFDSTVEASKCNEKVVDSKLFVEDVAIAPSRSNNQVSEASPDLGFQVKSESISTDSVSINDKIELKDYLHADNFHLELDNVKQETTKPSSSYVPSTSGDELLLDDGKVLVECSIAEEVDVTNTNDMDLIKKNESSEGGSPEKLNLDRSSGDESMEEYAQESKHLESISNEVEMKNEMSKIPNVEEENVDNVAVTGLTSVKMDVVAEVEMNPPAFAEKRKLEEIQAVTDEAPKRQRKWNTNNIEVAKVEKPNIKVIEVERRSVTTPKDSIHHTPRRSFARSGSVFDVDSSKERIVLPSEKPSTTSLRVDNFLRPFTLKAVQELLAKNGTVCKFWMDHIKTHCYVTYSSVEEAVAARNALYNLQWPTNGGRLLIADFVDPQDVKSRVDAPDQSPVSVTPSAAITTAHSFQQQQQAPQPSPRLHQQHQAPPAAFSSSAPTFQNPPVKERLPPPPPLPLPPPPPKKPEPPVVTLDDLFKKTVTTPRIYYLPLSEKQVAAKLAVRGESAKL